MKILLSLIRRWKTITAIIITLLIPTAYAAGSGNLPGVKKTDYKIITPAKEGIEKTLSLTGNINADQKATLRFQSSGLLAWVGVKEGQTVKKNQPIATLDRRSLEKSLRKEMNDYMSARDTFEDTQDSYKQTKQNKLVTQEIQRILNRAEYDLQNSVISFELQDLALRLATISTPIEGIVTRVTQPYAGINITPAGAEFDIVNPQTLYFEAELDEADLKDLKVGQQAKVTLDAYDTLALEGVVTYLSYAPISGASGTSYQVKISLPKEHLSKLRLYLNGDAQVVLDQKDSTLTLPTDALISQSGDQAKVLVLKDGKEEEQEITIGILTDDKVEVLSGLSSTSQVILKDNAGKK